MTHKLVKKLIEIKAEIARRVEVIDAETTRLNDERFELSESLK